MNPRQRLLAALAGHPVDRVPVWLLFPWHQLGCYVDVRRHPAWRGLAARAERDCVTLDRRGVGAAVFTPEVAHRRERVLADGWEIERETWTWKGLELVGERARHPATGERRVKHLLETEADLLRLAEFPFAGTAQVTAEVAARLPELAAERAEFPGEQGGFMLDCGEPVNLLYHWSNLESYALWSLDQDAVVQDLLQRMRIQKLATYRTLLQAGAADVYFLVGSELAAPPLVSRRTFARWIVPFAQELIALIHQHGACAIQHFHGQIRHLLPDFAAMGADAVHTIEAPPTGNCTLDQAYAVLGGRTTLIGNVQYDRFRAATPAEMRAEVHAVLDEAAGRRLILSPTAGPFDPDPDPRVIANYHAFIDAALEHAPSGSSALQSMTTPA